MGKTSDLVQWRRNTEGNFTNVNPPTWCNCAFNRNYVRSVQCWVYIHFFAVVNNYFIWKWRFRFSFYSCFLAENSFNTLVSGSKSDATGVTYELANQETVKNTYCVSKMEWQADCRKIRIIRLCACFLKALVPLSILEAQKAQETPKPFIFISAATHPPFLKKFLSTKRAVEQVRLYHRMLPTIND